MTYKLHLIPATPFDLLRYKTANGHIPYSEWLYDLDNPAFGRVQAHVDRMRAGNFGKSRFVGQSVLELKINSGPGYRVYYLRDGSRIVVLLCGGDKHSQSADIRQAYRCAADYWRRQL